MAIYDGVPISLETTRFVDANDLPSTARHPEAFVRYLNYR